MLKRLERIGVPKAHWDVMVSPATIEPGYAALEACERPYREASRVTIFGGLPGTGKSLAAAITLDGSISLTDEDGKWAPTSNPEDVASDEHQALFLNASRLDGYGADVDELERRALRIAWLALDDVGMGKSASSIAATRIENLLCERHDAERPTIITTNLAPTPFWQILGGIGGRLHDRASSDPVGWIDCLEPSRRRRRPR